MPEERKLVTILFADVTGSTALGETLDPEDARALMSRYYQHARQIIADHGGTLEKFIGDAVMAIFGLPQAHGNDAERALAAALALREAVAADSLLGERLLLRMGVNTGEVVATRDASAGDFLVTGDAVNVAARLQQAAEPGEILVGERTKYAGDAAFRFSEQRSIEVKGKNRPLAIFPLVGPRPVRALSRPLLIGRQRELAQLMLLRTAALDERHPQLVSIVAPAGTGKTRLLEEFLAGIEPVEGWQVATARCLPYGQTLTYWPLRGLLDELLGARFSPDRVAEVFVTGGYSQPDAERLAGLLLATLGVERGEPAERESIFNAWRLLVETLALQAPRIVVFEDLHWASESLLDLVEHITHPRTRAPLLIVVLSRPELLDRRPSWGGGRRSFTALALDALSQAHTRQLIDHLVPDGAPAAVRERIVERSGGNPFFAIELIRGLAARLADAADPAAPASAGLTALPDTLPDSVYEAVLARLDQLSEPERVVLQVAAVAGRTFRAATLQALVEEPGPGGIDTALDGLLARDLIAPAESETDTYAFRHILIRDVAYGTLSRGERVRLHAAAAAWLEQFVGGRFDEFAELIAYHYREAAQLARQSAVPLALPFDEAAAVHSLERAGAIVARMGAIPEARRHLEAAISLAPPEEHLRLYEQLGDCIVSGQAALDAYGAALGLWRARGETVAPLVGARLLRKILIGRTRWQGGVDRRLEEHEMGALRAEARRLVEAAGDEQERWRVRAVDLFWPFWRGSLTAMDEAEGRCLGPAAAAYFEACGNTEAASEALDGYFTVLVMSGVFAEAAAIAQRRLALPGLSYVERADAYHMLAAARLEAGDYAGCIEASRQAVDALGPALSQTWFADSRSGPLAACLSGSWSDLREFTTWLEEYVAAMGGFDGAHVLPPGYFSALHVAAAREDRATTERALAALERLVGPDPHEMQKALLAAYRDGDLHALDHITLSLRYGATNCVLALAVMFLSERGAPPQAEILRFARERADSERTDCLVCTVAIAGALAAGEDAELAVAIDDAERHGLVPHAARMRIVLAQRTGNGAPLERARPVLERLGDRQFLRRLEEVQGALTRSGDLP